MIKSNIARTAAILLAGVSAIGAFAMPARKGLQQITQPDGTVISVNLIGDENYHYYLSEDGYMLLADGDFFYYAGEGADGKPVSTGIRALPADKRSASDKQLLATIDSKRLIEAYTASRIGMPMRANNRIPAAILQRMAAPTRGQAGPGTYPGAAFPSEGEQRAIVILVEYSDVAFSISNANEYFERLLNEPGFSSSGATGSARDYFIEASSGVFKPKFDVYGPVKLPNRRSYYGTNDVNGDDQHPEQMIIQACNALDGTVDFSIYDGDKDGYIDNVIVYYAGKGENDGGPATAVWPHAWNVTSALDQPYKYDGVQLDSYACTNEVQGDGTLNGIGTVVHEFSHVLGLPDLYDTLGGSAFTPGEWDALDYGSYNNNSATPPTYSGFERYAFGWIEPQVINCGMNCRLENINDTNTCYIIPTSSENEFFILENRQLTGWDKYLPSHGMLIWHIDYNEGTWERNTVNNNASHQGVDIEEADDKRTDKTRANDVFPCGGKYTEFTDKTTPSMKTWSGKSLNLPITDIEEKGGVITFVVDGGPKIVGEATMPRLVEGSLYSDGFAVEWDAVDNALSYLVTLTDESDSPVAPYDKYDVGNATSFTFTGLEPEKTYKASIIAKGISGESQPSEQLVVVTPEVSVVSTKVKLLEATEIGEDSFTANWEASEDAEGYLLTVFTREITEPYVDTCDFTDGIDGLRQMGWTTSATAVYNSSSYCGVSTPSLKMANNGHYLATKDYDEDITGFSFWHRGASADAANTFTIFGKIDGEWTSLGDYSFDSSAGSVFTLIEIPSGVRAMKIVYNKVGVGNLAIDDVVVEWGGNKKDVLLAGFDNLNVGNVTSHTVKGLSPETYYFYTVRAFVGEEQSPLSDAMMVLTAKSPGTGIVDSVNGNSLTVDGRKVSAKVNAGDSFAIVDLSGNVWYESVGNGGIVNSTLPHSGFWIIRNGNKSYRLMVK